MMVFFNNDIFSNCGDPVHVLYSPVVDDRGVVELVESGKENTDEIIQSYAESCDLAVIIERFMNGDSEALYQRAGSYGDFTKMPSTFAEVLQKRIDADKLFYSLPVDIRQKFDNDSNQFFAQAGTDEWNSIMDPYFKVSDSVVNDTIVNEDVKKEVISE